MAAMDTPVDLLRPVHYLQPFTNNPPWTTFAERLRRTAARELGFVPLQCYREALTRGRIIYLCPGPPPLDPADLPSASPIGMVYYSLPTPDSLRIHQLVIHPCHRLHGHGRALLEHLAHGHPTHRQWYARLSPERVRGGIHFWLALGWSVTSDRRLIHLALTREA